MGRRHFSTSMTVFYLQRTDVDPVTVAAFGPAAGFRVGFTVSRTLGGAVQRNRMRRRLREAVRLCRPASECAVDIVINPKKAVLTTEFTALQAEITRAFAVIQKAPRRPENQERSSEN
jgi:ribonuclease P protein component